MIVLQASTAASEMTKPVICPKCERGRIGNIPEWCETVISRRGHSPPDERNEGVQVKCPVCSKLWTLIIE